MFRIVGVGTADTIDDAREFVRRTGVASFPMLWSAESDALRLLGVVGVPAGVVFDPDGYIHQRFLGTVDVDKLAAAMTPLVR